MSEEAADRIRVIVDDYLKTVIEFPDQFPAAHHKLVRDVGRDQESRFLAINYLVNWCLSTTLEDNSNCADIVAHTFKQLFVRYHGLSPDSPFGPHLFKSFNECLDLADELAIVSHIIYFTSIITKMLIPHL